LKVGMTMSVLGDMRDPECIAKLLG